MGGQAVEAEYGGGQCCTQLIMDIGCDGLAFFLSDRLRSASEQSLQLQTDWSSASFASFRLEISMLTPKMRRGRPWASSSALPWASAQRSVPSGHTTRN
jgi:hypothetical protein